MTTNMDEELMNTDPYLARLLDDLKEAESNLRRNIEYRGISFSQQRLDDSQANVDRLHKLIAKFNEQPQTKGKE